MLDNLAESGPAVLVFALLAALVCLWVAGARSIIHDARLSPEGKAGWIIVIFVAPYVGVIAWFALRRRGRLR